MKNKQNNFIYKLLCLFNKKKIIAFTLSFVMTITMLTTSFTSVSAASSAELYVNDVNILTASNNTVICGEGTAVYDVDTNVLTLTNATIKSTYNGKGINSTDNGNLKIKLVGDNQITTNASTQIHMGIGSDGALEIEGPGHLTITTGTASASFQTMGLYAYKGVSIMNEADIDILDTSVAPGETWAGVEVGQSQAPFNISNSSISIKNYTYGINVSDANINIEKSTIKGTHLNKGIYGSGTAVKNVSIVDSQLDLTVEGNKALGISAMGEIKSDNSDIKIISESSNAIYTANIITIENGSNLDVTGFYPALFSTLDTIITDSIVKAKSTDDSAIFSRQNIVISGDSDVTANGYYSAINSVNNLTINGGKINATSTNDIGIWARGILTLNADEVYAKGASNFAAIGTRYQKQPGDIDPVSKIVINSNFHEIVGGKISVSNWIEGTSNGVPYMRSWTSFISKDDQNELASNMSNALNEVTIKVKEANYSKVNDAIKDANALKADDYKNFSAVTAAINAVKKGMNLTQQKIVDDYATAIREEIDALEYKDANYDKVNAAIAKIPADLSIYTDDSVAKLNASKDAVVTGMNITQQEKVNGFATAIENAIKGLEKKSVEPTNPSNPTDPSDSSNPTDTSNPSKPGDSQSPQTEDNSIMLLWVAFLFISAGTLTMTLRKSKQKNKSQDK